jgi:hypothetical protein
MGLQIGKVSVCKGHRLIDIDTDDCARSRIKNVV